MGLPIKMVAAVTPNDIVHRTLQTGDFSLSETVLQTWATAMDIQVRDAYFFPVVLRSVM